MGVAHPDLGMEHGVLEALTPLLPPMLAAGSRRGW